MGQSAGKPPAAPDPSTILALQNQYNRSNSVGPFGSQSWSSGGPGGHETMTTNLSPQMQGAMDRAFSAAATPYQKEYIPQGADQLTSAILGRVGSRYGLSGSSFDTNLQHQKGQQQSPMPPQGMGPGLGSGQNDAAIAGMHMQPSPLGVSLGQMGGSQLPPGFSGIPQGMQGNAGGLSGMGLQIQPSPNAMPGRVTY